MWRTRRKDGDSFHLKHLHCFDARFFFFSLSSCGVSNSGLVTICQFPGIPNVFAWLWIFGSCTVLCIKVRLLLNLKKHDIVDPLQEYVSSSPSNFSVIIVSFMLILYWSHSSIYFCLLKYNPFYIIAIILDLSKIIQYCKSRLWMYLPVKAIKQVNMLSVLHNWFYLSLSHWILSKVSFNMISRCQT